MRKLLAVAAICLQVLAMSHPGSAAGAVYERRYDVTRPAAVFGTSCSGVAATSQPCVSLNGTQTWLERLEVADEVKDNVEASLLFRAGSVTLAEHHFCGSIRNIPIPSAATRMDVVTNGVVSDKRLACSRPTSGVVSFHVGAAPSAGYRNARREYDLQAGTVTEIVSTSTHCSTPGVIHYSRLCFALQPGEVRITSLSIADSYVTDRPIVALVIFEDDDTNSYGPAVRMCGSLASPLSVPAGATRLILSLDEAPLEGCVTGVIGEANVTLAKGISISDSSVVEGGSASFTLKLSGPVASEVTVEFQTVSGTAGTEDFVPSAGTTVFAPGDTQRTIVVATRQDTAREAVETFSVWLTSVSGVEIIDGSGDAQILDDD